MTIDVRAAQGEVVKALAEPMRWRMVELLAREELCVCHLVEELGATQPLVSHHLKVLRAVGLVTSERYRQWVYYRLLPDALEDLAQHLAGVTSAARTTTRRPCG